MDSFIWLKIASHINEYVVLCALSCTCRDLYLLCTQLKESFQAHYFCKIKRKCHQINNLLSNLKRKTENDSFKTINTPMLLDNLKLFNVAKQDLSDLHFTQMLKQSEQGALLTCVDRKLVFHGYKCIHFQINTFFRTHNMKIVVSIERTRPTYFTNILHPSILIHAFELRDFEEYMPIEDFNMLSIDVKKGKLNCFLWYKEQITDVFKDETVTAIVQGSCFASRFYFYNGGVLRCDQGEYCTSISSNLEKYDFRFPVNTFVCNTSPLTTVDLNFISIYQK